MAEDVPPAGGMAARFYLALMLLGLAFYPSWSVLYGTWDLTRPENTGVYALTVILVGFGATGFLLYRNPRRDEAGK